MSRSQRRRPSHASHVFISFPEAQLRPHVVSYKLKKSNILYDARGEKSLFSVSKDSDMSSRVSYSVIPDERRLGHTAGVAKVDDQREVSTVLLLVHRFSSNTRDCGDSGSS